MTDPNTEQPTEQPVVQPADQPADQPVVQPIVHPFSVPLTGVPDGIESFNEGVKWLRFAAAYFRDIWQVLTTFHQDMDFPERVDLDHLKSWLRWHLNGFSNENYLLYSHLAKHINWDEYYSQHTWFEIEPMRQTFSLPVPPRPDQRLADLIKPIRNRHESDMLGSRRLVSRYLFHYDTVGSVSSNADE